jgi:CRP/FNR family cyclic AMP-dependent transcriptional regulator
MLAGDDVTGTDLGGEVTVQWPILADLAEDDRARVLKATTRRNYARDDLIVHQGDPGGAFHLLAQGRVAVRVSTPEGEVVTLSVLGPGDFFGEQALLGARHERTASVVALERVETFSMAGPRFDQLRRAHPSVEHLLVEVLAAQVRRLTTHLVEALYVPAEQRTLRRLIALLGRYRGSGEPLVVPITQEELATMAGTTRSTVNRVLRTMEDAGALQLSRGRIEVLSVDALRQRASAPRDD